MRTSKGNTRELPFPGGAFRPRDEGDRGRVLVECSDPALAWVVEERLVEEGYDAVSCWGPTRGGGAGCPLLCGKGCPLVESADVIVQSIPFSQRKTFPILEAVREAVPQTPVCVEVAEPSRWKLGEALAGCAIIDLPMTTDRLLAAVDGCTRHQALGGLALD